MTHICVSKLTIIGSDNGLPPDRRQAIISTNAWILLTGPLGTNFSEISIEIRTFSFKKMRLKVSSAKRRPFCLGLNVLTLRRHRQLQCLLIEDMGLVYPVQSISWLLMTWRHKEPGHSSPKMLYKVLNHFAILIVWSTYHYQKQLISKDSHMNMKTYAMYIDIHDFQ